MLDRLHTREKTLPGFTEKRTGLDRMAHRELQTILHAALLAGLAGLGASGCRRPQPPRAALPPPNGPGPVSPGETEKPGKKAEPTRPKPPASLSRDSAGPFRLGMEPREFGRPPNTVILPVEVRQEGRRSRAYRVQQFGLPVALVEMEEGRVWRIRVVTPDYYTAAGAHVGSTARQLEKLYGPGRVISGEGNVCATFKKAPGLSFCFEKPNRLANVRDWKSLTSRNPKVGWILVVGESE